MNEILFTPSSILSLLLSIDELSDYDISVQEELNGDIEIKIGSSAYQIGTNDIEQLPVSDDIIQTIDEINAETYEDLVETQDVEYSTIESGILKEIGKTLLVGGLVRLTNKLLRK